MKVAHIVAGLHNPSAGTTYYVLRLAAALAQCGVAAQIHTLRPVPGNVAARGDVVSYPAFQVIPRLGVSPTMRQRLSAVSADVFHNHGVWMSPNVYAGAMARKRPIPLVSSPHGMLTEWAMAFHRWRKRFAWWCLGQGRALEATTCFHATTESEAEDIRRLGFRQPIAVVPYGVDVPPPSPKPDRKGQLRRVLFLSRVHPKKGVPLLLEAWAKVEPVHPDWELVVAGPDQTGHLAQVKALGRRLGLQRVSFPGGIYSEEKSALYRSADLFVLPTHSENFGLVVAEALAHSLPVITTTGAPWEGLRRRGCGWWIELTVENLTDALHEAMSSSEAIRQEMGKRGHTWVGIEFSWPAIAAEMRSVYEWVAGGGSPPGCLVTD